MALSESDSYLRTHLSDAPSRLRQINAELIDRVAQPPAMSMLAASSKALPKVFELQQKPVMERDAVVFAQSRTQGSTL
jgi:hypothetical protein